MTAHPYEFKKFLEDMVDKDFHEILATAEQTCMAVERQSYSVRGAPRARRMGSVGYASSLKAFLFFMRTGAVPAGVSREEVALYRPVCEALVQKKQFKPTVLKLFE